MHGPDVYLICRLLLKIVYQVLPEWPQNGFRRFSDITDIFEIGFDEFLPNDFFRADYQHIRGSRHLWLIERGLSQFLLKLSIPDDQQL